MEEICDQIQKEIQNLKNKKEYQNDCVCQLHLKNLNLAKEEEISKDSFKELDISQIIEKLKSFEEEDFYFRKMLYKKLSEENFLQLISQKIIPSNYKLQVIQYIISLKNKSSIEDLKSLIKTNKTMFTENEVLFIINHIDELEMNKEIISLLISEIAIDHRYLLQLIKKDEIYALHKNEVILLNNCLNECENINYGWLDFMKSLNMISYIKKRLSESEFTEFEKNITEKYEALNNRNNDNNIVNSSRLNIDLVRKIQNRGNILQENIFV